MGISFAFTPHAPSLFLYYLTAFICGLGGGAFDCASTVWLIEMWQKRCNTFLQLTQFCFGIGTILSPLISKPYVHGKQDDGLHGGNLTTTTEANLFDIQDNFIYPPSGLTKNHLKITRSERISCLTLPFVIIGSMQLMAGVFQCILMLYKKYEYVESNESERKTSRQQRQTVADDDDDEIKSTNGAKRAKINYNV